jgi:hypothetical protein
MRAFSPAGARSCSGHCEFHMDNLRLRGQPYRVSGANQISGEDVEVTLNAHDEADAMRMANRQGILVSTCTAVAAQGTFSQAVGADPVIRALLQRVPQLAYRVQRLNADDEAFFSNIAGQQHGVSHRDGAHLARLIAENRHLPRS